MTGETREPRTRAGRRLLQQEAFNSRPFALITADAILAIEDEAATPPSTDSKSPVVGSLGPARSGHPADGPGLMCPECDSPLASHRVSADGPACRNCGHPQSSHGDDKAPQWERACWSTSDRCSCPGFAGKPPPSSAEPRAERQWPSRDEFRQMTPTEVNRYLASIGVPHRVRAPQEPRRRCGCTADTELGAEWGCAVCGHGDHGKSGCRAPQEPQREPGADGTP